MSLGRGTRVGPYEILSVIGAGGMGEVYRARDGKLGRDVALKVLPDLLAADPERLGRFEREARTLASLNHPQIAHIYGFEQSPSTSLGQAGVSALVMELVEGEDLSHRIARGAIPPDEALPIAKQIAEALEAAHEQGIIHRDLKPANIKVRADGTVKVLDFGLAKALDPPGASGRPGDAAGNPIDPPTITSPAMTLRGMILGTAAYMAPEQAKGKPLDKRADIWAFGAVLYEMLTGRRAFPGEDVTETLAFVITREVDWTALPSSTPASIRKLLRRCLEKDRKRRLADASDARLEIEDALSQPSVVPETPLSTARPGGGWSRVLAAAAISGAVCAAAGALAVRQWWTPTLPLASPTRFVIVAPPNQLFRAVGRTVSLSPDGSRMALALSDGLYIRSIGSLEPRLVTGADPGALSPTFSPDGQSIAYWSVRDQTIKSISVAGGAPVVHGAAVRDGGAVYSGMSWDRTGIIVAQGTGGVVRFPAGGGPADVIVEVAPGEVAASPIMLPDGEHLLFTVVTGTSNARWVSAQVVAQSLETRARKQIVARGSDPVYLPTGHLVFAVDGVMFAGPLDLTRLELTAPAVPVVEGVRRASVSTQMSQFSVADNGTLAYVPGPVSASSALLDLAVTDRKGTTTALGLPPGAYEAPRISPDGKRVAFHSDDGKEAVVWTYELGGTSAPRRITFNGRNRFPIWMADGRDLVFQSDREGDLGLFRQRADGSDRAERLTRAESGVSHLPESWSPVSGHLLLTSARDGEFSLLVRSTADMQVKPFGGVHSFTPTSAAFAPDGQWVAYATTEKGRPVSIVFVQPFPATGAVYQVSRDDDGHHPAWTRDGKELVYVPGPGIMAGVSVTTVPSFAFTRPILLPAAGIQGPPTIPRNFDIVDATRFIGLVAATGGRPAEQSAPQVHVVLNWFTELTARVPVK